MNTGTTLTMRLQCAYPDRPLGGPCSSLNHYNQFTVLLSKEPRHKAVCLIHIKQHITLRNITLSVTPHHAMESIKLARISLTMFMGCASRSLKTDSITDSSVDVVSSPQNAAQSLTTMPAPMTSLPRLTVPATRGICSREESSSRSSMLVFGCTMPP